MKKLFILIFFVVSTITNSILFSQTIKWQTDFESGSSVPTYSLTTGNSLGLSTTGGNSAAYSGRIVANGAPSKTYDGCIITNSTISFTTGKYYEVVVWAKYVTATGKLQIYKNSTNTNAAMKTSSGGDVILSSSSNNVTSTSYTKYTVGFTVLSNETKYVGFQMIQTTTASANVYIDDITITEYDDPQCSNYCKPTSTGSASGHITNVTFNTINRNSTYDGYICTGVSTSVEQASSYTFSVTKTTTYSASITAWIDYNKNGTFESGENVVTFSSNSTSSQNTSVLIPSDATIGNTKMRVMFKYNASATGPCDATSTYYDVEDYDITIDPQPNCSGTPNPGNTISNTNPVCDGSNITLSLQNTTPGNGVTYQWQSSSNNVSWTNESGTNSTFNTTINSNKYYRCIVTCGGNNGTSNPVYVTINLMPSCYGLITATTDDATGLTEVIFNTINNQSTGNAAYSDFSATYNTNVTQGDIYQLSIRVNTNGNYTVFAKAWVDWNQDGTYNTTTEEYDLGSVKNVTNSPTSLSPLLITIPNDAILGETFVRIRATYNTAPTNSGNQNYSEAEDYKLIISSPTPLPVELLYFDGVRYPTFNNLKWTTASEQNSSHFNIERSEDGEDWRVVGTKSSAGNSQSLINYSYLDYYNQDKTVYYRLVQYDIDGKYVIYGPIVLEGFFSSKKIVKYINLAGQEVNETYKGVVFEVYEDGTMRKIIR